MENVVPSNRTVEKLCQKVLFLVCSGSSCKDSKSLIDGLQTLVRAVFDCSRRWLLYGCFVGIRHWQQAGVPPCSMRLRCHVHNESSMYFSFFWDCFQVIVRELKDGNLCRNSGRKSLRFTIIRWLIYYLVLFGMPSLIVWCYRCNYRLVCRYNGCHS